jgi:hypothetical protein
MTSHAALIIAAIVSAYMALSSGVHFVETRVQDNATIAP